MNITYYLQEFAVVAGTVAFAASGAFMGIQKKLDMLGITVLGIITAVGGGIIRDLLLGITPPFAFLDPRNVVIAAAVSILIFFFSFSFQKKSFPTRSFGVLINIFDAIGLGIFSVLGVDAAMVCGHGENVFLCVFMGTITGVGGGMLRDLLAAQIPAVLEKRIYAIASLAGAALYYLLTFSKINDSFSLFACAGIVVLIRLLAAHFRWNLPRPPQNYEEQEEK